jgi:hypothetical protein
MKMLLHWGIAAAMGLGLLSAACATEVSEAPELEVARTKIEPKTTCGSSTVGTVEWFFGYAEGSYSCNGGKATRGVFGAGAEYTCTASTSSQGQTSYQWERTSEFFTVFESLNGEQSCPVG